ncbi:MAG: hypothetical protein JSW53_00525 [Candidatus Bathyarchaeota archaeon]|nr:MAG: hypothetical protein JSW53_00525 [Candidatus Bathyarchaeota archaeon]
MIESCDSGSLPLIGNERTFLEGAASPRISGEESTIYFRRRVVESFLDKVEAGIDVPSYPQFRDMNQMFLKMIDGVEKSRDGYVETGVFSLKAGNRRIPEVLAIEESSHEIHERLNEVFRLRVCVTGPYTLSALFPYRDTMIFARLGDIISRIVENNIFNGKYGSVALVAVDEPTFGLVDDHLIDHGSEGRKNLRKAWDSIFRKASSKDLHTCLHLHNTADRLFWDVPSLNIIESHVDDSLYHARRTGELLESTDKFLKASLCITDFDKLIRSRIVADSKQELSESLVNQRVAKAWKDIAHERLDIRIFLEDEGIMEKRLNRVIKRFGEERISYAGPECGLKSFPSYESALEVLRRVSKATKKLQDK